MLLYNIPTFCLKMENIECYDEIATYTVEIPTNEQNTPEFKEAKEKELQNLDNMCLKKQMIMVRRNRSRQGIV